MSHVALSHTFKLSLNLSHLMYIRMALWADALTRSFTLNHHHCVISTQLPLSR